MPSPSGQLIWFSGRPYVRVSVGNNKRPYFELGCTSKEDALKRVALVSNTIMKLRQAGRANLVEELASRTAEARTPTDLEGVQMAVRAICSDQVVARPKFDETITFQQFAEKWTSDELHELYKRNVKSKKTAGQDVHTLSKWVYPKLGNKPIALITSDDCDEVLNDIPDDRSEYLVRQVAQVMYRVMNLAVTPAKILKVSPLQRGFLPSITKKKARTYLYVEEDKYLLGCTDIYLVLRILYGMLAREGLRVDEALTLDICDLDLKNGAINLDRNKTDDPRTWALDPGVARALHIWTRYFHPSPSPSSRLFVYPLESRAAKSPLLSAARAEELRANLKRAGCRRKQLFERGPDRRPICIHDLRATFVTLALASDRTETWVADRTGHKSSKMINEYRRQARCHAELNMGKLAPLVDAIPELAAVDANLRAEAAAKRTADAAAAAE